MLGGVRRALEARAWFLIASERVALDGMTVCAAVGGIQDMCDAGLLKELLWMLEHPEPVINFSALEVFDPAPQR